VSFIQDFTFQIKEISCLRTTIFPNYYRRVIHFTLRLMNFTRNKTLANRSALLTL